ncbi:protein ripply3 [Narcine bancroftii]|uniref:protein ripply3 n=1 Tax=Narcine bancroftii TaxID=1343680 RepID=UPI003831BA9B
MEAALHSVRPKVVHTCRWCRGRHAEGMSSRQPQSSSALWRPWVITARDTGKNRQSSFGSAAESSPGTNQSLGFKHPVRLYLPRSKADHYLHLMGEKVLASFPVQATMHFYNDDSDTEEEEEWENAPETSEMLWKQ